VGAIRRIIGAVIDRALRHLRWRRARAGRSVRAARVVDETWAYLARELRPRSTTGTYTVGTRRVVLRHHTQDTQIFQEIFTAGFYRLSPPAARALGDPRRIVDLGGNIGIFGLWAAIHWPNADVVAFEPDPANAARYRTLLRDNDLPWRLVEACATAHAGTVRFAAGQESTSMRSEAGALEVPAVDALPALADADLIKMDIEGGEWELLLDPRFADGDARVVLMEYHPHLCPTDDPRALAEHTLTAAGYTVVPILHAPEGHGMLCAFRSARRG
jgi:FkbM family methyltransferase